MIDKTDHKIIELLKVNSKTSFAELSKKVSLSPSSVRERINKLEDIGVIKGYSLKLNQSMLGNSLEVFILLKVFTGKLQYVIPELNNYPEILKAHRITGPHNFHLKVAVRDQLHLQQFIDKLVTIGEPTSFLILSELESNPE